MAITASSSTTGVNTNASVNNVQLRAIPVYAGDVIVVVASPSANFTASDNLGNSYSRLTVATGNINLLVATSSVTGMCTITVTRAAVGVIAALAQTYHGVQSIGQSTPVGTFTTTTTPSSPALTVRNGSWVVGAFYTTATTLPAIADTGNSSFRGVVITTALQTIAISDVPATSDGSLSAQILSTPGAQWQSFSLELAQTVNFDVTAVSRGNGGGAAITLTCTQDLQVGEVITITGMTAGVSTQLNGQTFTVAVSGTTAGTVTRTATTITVNNSIANGAITSQAQTGAILVNRPPPPIVLPNAELMANPDTITLGQSSTLTWNTSALSNIYISSDDGTFFENLVTDSGSLQVTPFVTTEYGVFGQDIFNINQRAYATVTVESITGGNFFYIDNRTASVNSGTVGPFAVVPGDIVVIFGSPSGLFYASDNLGTNYISYFGTGQQVFPLSGIITVAGNCTLTVTRSQPATFVALIQVYHNSSGVIGVSSPTSFYGYTVSTPAMNVPKGGTVVGGLYTSGVTSTVTVNAIPPNFSRGQVVVGASTRVSFLMDVLAVNAGSVAPTATLNIEANWNTISMALAPMVIPDFSVSSSDEDMTLTRQVT